MGNNNNNNINKDQKKSLSETELKSMNKKGEGGKIIISEILHVLDDKCL